MDTTPEYILKCEKAFDFQKGRAFNIPNRFLLREGFTTDSHYFLFTSYHVPTCDFDYWWIELGSDESFDWHNVKKTWLPRQDQLQEMVEQVTCWAFLWYFPDWAKVEGLKGSISEEASMEELWLHFVMHVKFGKTWNTEKKEWEKAWHDIVR